jgi:hypothetical protein
MKIYSHIIYATALALVAVSQTAVYGEDYQYQYFTEEKKYTPFSDYIPRSRLHYKTVPHFLEDYYLLYTMRQHYNENTLRKNIERLKTALQCKFRHPSQALTRIDSEEEYLKYRNLMFMHINMLLLRDHLKIAARYDMRRVKFYHRDFADDIRKSLDIAEQYYRDALPYWEQARLYASRASEIRITTDLGTIESQRYSIVTGATDFGKIIAGHLEKIEKNRARLDTAMSDK